MLKLTGVEVNKHIFAILKMISILIKLKIVNMCRIEYYFVEEIKNTKNANVTI